MSAHESSAANSVFLHRDASSSDSAYSECSGYKKESVVFAKNTLLILARIIHVIILYDLSAAERNVFLTSNFVILDRRAAAAKQDTTSVDSFDDRATSLETSEATPHFLSGIPEQS